MDITMLNGRAGGVKEIMKINPGQMSFLVIAMGGKRWSGTPILSGAKALHCQAV
jgi:hypothetical protein